MRSQQAPAIRLQDYREPQYRILDVFLDVNLGAEETVVKNTMTIERARETEAGTPLVLDGDELELVRLEVEGKEAMSAKFALTNTTLTLASPPRKRTFQITVTTRINPAANTKLMGLYRSGGNYCTQCEAEGFRRITYFLDRPDVLSVYKTRIEADKTEAPILLGNGNPVEAGDLAGGRHYAVWHDPHPKPSYLFALVGGDLGSIFADYKTASGRDVRLGIYVEKGKEQKAEYAMDALVRSMRWDEEVFGCEYDLDVFNIVAVSDFNMGAMENKGLNIFNDKYVLADPQTATDADYANIEAIIAHEYFHNWTGNRITCRDWFQLCLKEGLTVFRDQEFSSDMRSRPVQRISQVRRLKAAQFPEDAGPLAHPVRPETYREINNFYTATVYEKGAEVVRMFKTILGETDFTAGMSLYLSRHDGDAATIEDFITCFEEASGRSLKQFALWYSQAGTPTIAVAAKHDRSSGKLTVELEQSLSPTPGQNRKKLMHIPLRIGLVDQSGNDLVPAKITGIETTLGDHAGDIVFHVTKRSHKIEFHGVASRPVLSINRGFSAPINLDFRQTKADLAHLAASDGDPFNRAQAIQDFAIRLLVKAAKALSSNKAPVWDDAFAEACLAIARDQNLEPAFRALALSLPSESDIAQAWGRNINPDAIFRAQRALMAKMGEKLEPYRAAIFAEIGGPYAFSPDAASAGIRSLRNTLLTLGVLANSNDAETMSLSQFDEADNMTDRFAAFRRIVECHGSRHARKNAVEVFYELYKDDHIALDKWFQVLAGEPGPDGAMRVRDLMDHPQFTLSNPNRVRSVIGVFATANPSGFNAVDGSGYRVVAESVRRLDALNPQVAARLLTSFRSFKALEPVRRKLALAALTELQESENLSRDVSDILDRTLTA